MEEKPKKTVNIKKINELINQANLVLRILIVFLIVIGIYAGIKILKETKIISFIFRILGIISPLFIGLIIAWLLDPIVTFLNKKGLKRIFGSLICYIFIIGAIVLIAGSLIPVLYEQINDLVTITIPSLYESAQTWITDFFEGFKNVDGIDAETMKTDIFNKLEDYVSSLTSLLPTLIVNAVKAIFSGIGSLAVGLIIGFFLLLNMDEHIENLYLLIPKKYR